jgi:hypothetical protein
VAALEGQGRRNEEKYTLRPKTALGRAAASGQGSGTSSFD